MSEASVGVASVPLTPRWIDSEYDRMNEGDPGSGWYARYWIVTAWAADRSKNLQSPMPAPGPTMSVISPTTGRLSVRNRWVSAPKLTAVVGVGVLHLR